MPDVPAGWATPASTALGIAIEASAAAGAPTPPAVDADWPTEAETALGIAIEIADGVGGTLPAVAASWPTLAASALGIGVEVAWDGTEPPPPAIDVDATWPTIAETALGIGIEVAAAEAEPPVPPIQEIEPTGLTIEDIRTGLAFNLRNVPELTESAYVQSAPQLPCAHVVPADINFHQAFRGGLNLFNFTVQVLVAKTTDVGSQKLLDRYLAPTGSYSVKAALEQDITLAGTVADVTVTGTTGYRMIDRPGLGPALGAEWQVEVRAPD